MAWSIGGLAAALLQLLGPGGCAALGELAERLYTRPQRLRRLLAELEGLEEDGEGRICLRDPVAAAVSAVRMGASETVVARGLDWRMFEEYAARALGEAGMETWRGLRRPGAGGFELDVLGLDPVSGLGVALDCKHWSPRSTVPSRLRAAAERQRRRLRLLAEAWSELGLPRPPARRRHWLLVPALLVLRENVPRLLEGVYVVPASRLRGFLEELPVLAEEPGASRVYAPLRTSTG